jgi:hypothetical protein
MKLLEKRRRSKWENTGRWSSVRWWGTTRWWRHRRSVRLWASSRPWDFERSGRRRSTLWNCPFVSLVWLLLLCCSYCFPILTRLCFQTRKQINNIPRQNCLEIEQSLTWVLFFSATCCSSQRTHGNQPLWQIPHFFLDRLTYIDRSTCISWQIHISLTDPHLQWDLFPCKRCNSFRQGFFSTPSFRNLHR